MAKKPTKSKVKSFEESLWDSANKLGGSVKPFEQKYFKNLEGSAVHNIV